MRTNKKAARTQRRIMDTKIKPWLGLRRESNPRSGWLKAIRSSLGLSTRQLAKIVGINFSSLIRLEARESSGKVTLELMDKVANAMGCKVVYAIVPIEAYNSLESIVDTRSRTAAKKVIASVEHSMRLEDQGSVEDRDEIERLALDLKEKMDNRIWDVNENKTHKQKRG